MKFTGSDNFRINSVIGVYRVELKPNMTNTSYRRCHTLCYKLSGSSLHTTNEDSFLCKQDTVLYLPPQLTYSVKNIEPGPSIAIDFLAENDISFEQHIKLLDC